MKVSLLINNFNYAPFVGTAIESALKQDHPDCEVIVVDDGSTDDSWRVIESFGDSVRASRQENSGQGAAYNNLWSMARGDYVLFLDADDCLDRNAVSTCLDATTDDTASVQFRLRLMDESGAILPGAVPYLMHDGYVTPIVRRFVHYAGPPGSGNFYSARAIARAFPLDAPFWRRGADTIPFVAAAFAGRITPLRRALGSYRLHRARVRERAAGILGNIDKTYRATMEAAERRRKGSLAMLRQGYGVSLPGPFLPPPSEVRMRALSWRLDRENHPYPDTRASLLQLQRETLRNWPGFGRLEKLTLMSWMMLVLSLPTPLVRRLAATNISGGAKAWVKSRLGDSTAQSSGASPTQSSGASSTQSSGASP